MMSVIARRRLRRPEAMIFEARDARCEENSGKREEARKKCMKLEIKLF